MGGYADEFGQEASKFWISCVQRRREEIHTANKRSAACYHPFRARLQVNGCKDVRLVPGTFILTDLTVIETPATIHLYLQAVGFVRQP